MKIEERVSEAVGAGVDGNYSKGMALICPAIEASARKLLRKSKVTNTEFKDFLRGYYFIIEAFIGAGLNLEKTRFPDVVIESDAGRQLKTPDFAELIYHAFRCSLAHGHEISDAFAFTAGQAQGVSTWIISKDGRIQMPDKTLWALIACVVFCKANVEISTKTALHLTWGGAPAGRNPPYHFDIDVFWGAEDTVRAFLAKQDLIRTIINPFQDANDTPA